MLIIAALLALILLLKINLIIKARDKRWTLSVKVLGIIVIQRRYEVRREHGELLTLYSVDKKEKRIFSVTDMFKTIKSADKAKTNEQARGMLFKYVNKKSKYSLDITLKIGLGDACATAIVCGVILSFLRALKSMNVDKRHLVAFHVLPEYANLTFSFIGDCIITLSLANIIVGYIIYKIKKRR